MFYSINLQLQVFDDLQLEAYDLNVDNLDVHAVRYNLVSSDIHSYLFIG